MKSAYVVSDLHMFCRRSQWNRHLDAIDRAARKADLFVFNGDTVDFKWSALPTVDATVDKAIMFFEELAEKHPRCRFHVNLGNHDHIKPFMHALDELAFARQNVTWHPYFLRVGAALFLHGDVAMRKMNHKQLERYRAGWMEHKPKGRLQNHVYDAAFRMKAHVAVSRLAFPQRLTIRRVAAYLEDIGHCGRSGVKRVYFGHTHVPVNGGAYRGVEYHNGGAPMPGMGFKVMRALVA